MASQKVPLVAKLNLETAQIAWKDLQTFFANGSVLFVSDELDLLRVAEQLAADNTTIFEQWLADGKVALVSDSQALAWYESDAMLWSLVIKPWILVQQNVQKNQLVEQ